MAKFKEYVVNESVEFSKMENNPLVYTLIAPRVAGGAEIDDIKNDEMLKAAITATEKFIRENLNKEAVKLLTGMISPVTVIDMFKLSTNYKNTFATFFCDFKKVACGTLQSFSKCVELDRKFDELYRSPEYLSYLSTL